MKFYRRIHAENYKPETKVIKHKIGKRENEKLSMELNEIKKTLVSLREKDEEGFQKFYYDVETNSKMVQRQNWIEEVLQRGFYYIEKEI